MSINALAGKTGVYDPIQQAEREDRIVRVYVDSITNVATQTILTNTAFNLVPDSVLFITQMFATIETYTDFCEFELVKYTGQNASGTGTRLSAQIVLFSAAAGLGFQGHPNVYIPAITVRYKDGWRSVAIRVDANDAAAIIGTGWAGYWEIEDI
jgi:hypothetical protein